MYQLEFSDHPEDVIQTLRYAQNCITTSMPPREREKHLLLLERVIKSARIAHAVPAVPAFESISLTEARERHVDKVARFNQQFIGIEDPNADHPVHHPNHYTAYKGLEIIDLTEQMNFNRGNAVKYIARAGLKDKGTEIQDLQKAAWYINREIERVQSEQA